MSIVGGSMVTTEGLSRMVEDGVSIVPRYFKFSSQDINLSANLTAADIDGWIQKNIVEYIKVDEQTIEFVCDVLPGDAIQTTNLCGMYLEDGTLFMVAKPVHEFPSDLRQTFRIQLVYENAEDILNFTYLDLSDTDIRFQAVESSITLLDQTVNTRIDNVISNHETDRDAALLRIDALENGDTSVDARIDTLESTFNSTQAAQDISIGALQDNRQIDVQQVNDYISSNDTAVQSITPALTTIINTNDAASIARDDALDIRIDEIVTNNDTGTMRQDIDANTLAISTNYSTITDLIDDNAANDLQDKNDITSLLTAETNARIAGDSALDTRVSAVEQDIVTNYNSVTSDISTINALIISNKSDLENGIQSNTDAIAALGSTDTSALQNQLDLLEGTVTSNNTNINNALTASDNASNTWNDNQDDAIALNTFFRTDTFGIAQGVQDQALIDSISAQDTINGSDDTRLINIEAQLGSLPDAGALDDLLTDMDEMATLTGEMIDGTQTVGHALIADKWTTPRTVTMTGDVTGNFTIDGSQNVSFATTVQVEALPAGGTVNDILTNTASGVGTWQANPALLKTGGTLTGDLYLANDGGTLSRAIMFNGASDVGADFGIRGNAENLEFFEGTEESGKLHMTLIDDQGLNIVHNLWVGVNATITGNMSAGSITETSARRFKENITSIDNALETVQKLDGVTYDWIASNEPDIGFIAEDVLDVLPELVSFNEEGLVQGMNYSKITALLVNAIKEQQVQIKALQDLQEA